MIPLGRIVCVYTTLGRRVMETRSSPSCSRYLVALCLFRRLGPSLLLPCRRSLGRLSWVGSPLLVRVGLLPLPLLLLLLGVPTVASGVVSSFASAVPSGVASVVPPAVTSSFAPSTSAPLYFSVASLFAPPSSSVLPSVSLPSSQPVGPSFLVSFGSGDAVVVAVAAAAAAVVVAAAAAAGATAVPANIAAQGGRLPVFDDAGVFTEPLNFPQGEESDTRLPAESAGAFRQVLSFISSFFPEALPSESQPPNLVSWFQGFGGFIYHTSTRLKNLWWTLIIK